MSFREDRRQRRRSLGATGKQSPAGGLASGLATRRSPLSPLNRTNRMAVLSNGLASQGEERVKRCLGGEPTEEPRGLVMVLAGDDENGFAFDLVDEPVLVGDAAGPEA